MSKQIIYALLWKDEKLTHLSTSLEWLDKKINKSFWAWRGMQEKGSKAKIKDYLKDAKKVKLTVEDIGEEVI